MLVIRQRSAVSKSDIGGWDEERRKREERRRREAERKRERERNRSCWRVKTTCSATWWPSPTLRLLAPSQLTPTSPSHDHPPLHLCQRRLARVKPRRRQLTTQWTIRVPTPIKSLRYSPASLPPPRQPATPHARLESLSSFSLFLPLLSPRGQASWPAGHTTRDY